MENIKRAILLRYVCKFNDTLSASFIWWYCSCCNYYIHILVPNAQTQNTIWLVFAYCLYNIPSVVCNSMPPSLTLCQQQQSPQYNIQQYMSEQQQQHTFTQTQLYYLCKNGSGKASRRAGLLTVYALTSGLWWHGAPATPTLRMVAVG